MLEGTKRNFILQQGLGDPAPAACSRQYSVLQFQPRIVLFWIITGIVLQSAAVFGVLCAFLWWGAVFPRLNVFDALYNRAFGRKPGTLRLNPAPMPRRAAQLMGGSFALLCALLLSAGAFPAAYVVEGVFLAAVLALVLGGFCLGSFVYHLMSGRGRFAVRTLPWQV